MASSVDKELNIYLDLGEKYIKTPSGKDVKIGTDPLTYATRLDQIDSPTRRLYVFLNSYFDILQNDITQEAEFVRMMTFFGLFGGMTYGCILHNQNIRERFIRKHNKAAFDSQHIAQRKYYDYMVSRTLSRGFKYGLRGALLTTSAGLVSFGSMIYRNKIYAPDWLIGYAICGAATRFMLGPRAWLFGAGAGAVAGTIGLACAKGSELFSGMSIAQIRYLNHTDWLRKRMDNYNKIMIAKEKKLKERYDELENGAEKGLFSDT